MFKNRRKYIYILGSFFLLFYILPNVLNFRERKFFSGNRRIKEAKERSAGLTDSVTVVPGEYYRRSGVYTYLFGEKNRELWITPATFRVFNYDTVKGGLIPYEEGGSQQTISIRLEDTAGRHWVLRSVNKDQKNVLPWWLRPSILRPVFRDQVAAMNPYAAKVVASLAVALKLPHVQPEIYWVPYVETYGKFNERIAGRIVYLEQHPDSSWRNEPLFGTPRTILDAEEMEEMSEKEKIAVDTLLYLKTRLFDMLINDWDRHNDQWKWALTDSGGKKLFKPIGRDRDVAFYLFDEGPISKLAVGANEKFQSYREKFESIAGLMKQPKELDKQLLKNIPKHHFIFLARQVQSELTPPVIEQAFLQYPGAIYPKYGKRHEQILVARLAQLPEVAVKFYELINND